MAPMTNFPAPEMGAATEVAGSGKGGVAKRSRAGGRGRVVHEVNWYLRIGRNINADVYL